MKSQIRIIFLVFLLLIFVIDGIAFAGLWFDFSNFRDPAVAGAYWIIPVSFVVGLYLYGRKFLADNRPGFFAGFYVYAGIFLSFYIPKLLFVVFVLLEIILKLVAFPFYRFFSETEGMGEFLMTGPLNFLSLAVLPLSILAFFMFIGGMLFGRFKFRLRSLEIPMSDLPSAFDGLKLIHISDLHLGSLYGHQEKIRRAVEMINRETPDMIVFTGDLVNNLAEETEGWTGILSEMKARHGKLSILGNHDYGEYYNWPDEESRMDNMRRLYAAHRQSGFSLLKNQSVGIERDDQKIFVAGVENWGLPPFKQYGDLSLALKDIPDGSFTILLSHDPSHWDEEVRETTQVQLTLSGHTHGMQFGIRIGRFRWSPIQLKYPRWIGLYTEGSQYLHVNPGLGYIGYAGRICIPPEITLITLKTRLDK